MKKFLIISFVIVAVLVVAYLLFPYKIKTVCFGDLCPQNGGTYLFYKKTYTEEECLAKGALPVTGIGWVRVYAGCSPDNGLSKWVEQKFNPIK